MTQNEKVQRFSDRLWRAANPREAAAQLQRGPHQTVTEYLARKKP